MMIEIVHWITKPENLALLVESGGGDVDISTDDSSGYIHFRSREIQIEIEKSLAEATMDILRSNLL